MMAWDAWPCSCWSSMPDISGKPACEENDDRLPRPPRFVMAGYPKDDVSWKNVGYPVIETGPAGMKALVSDSNEPGSVNEAEGGKYSEGRPVNEDCSMDEGYPKNDRPVRSSGMSDASDTGVAAARIK
jgi:hypothetical protein